MLGCRTFCRRHWQTNIDAHAKPSFPFTTSHVPAVSHRERGDRDEEACHSAYVVVNDRDSDDSEGSPPPRDESEATMKQRASAETNL